MNNEKLSKLGLTIDDLEKQPGSNLELIESITTSGRLYRKSLQFIILKNLRTSLNNSQLNYDDNLRPYFPYWGRRQKWKDFRGTMNFKTPDLRATKLTIGIMIAFTLIYISLIIKLKWDNVDFFIHASLSGIPLDGVFFFGLVIPLIGIHYIGKTDLPAKDIDGLVDKIIRKNIFDLFDSDKTKLKNVIENELNTD